MKFLPNGRTVRSGVVFFLVLSFFFVLCLASYPQSNSNTDPENTENGIALEQINLQGNKNIKQETILGALDFSVGDTVTREQLQKSSEKIADLGYFTEVKTDLKKENGLNTLVITVNEYPKINEIAFKGNNKVKSNKLKEDLKDAGVKTGEVLNKPALDKGLKNIQKTYENKGYPLIQINNVDISETLTVEIVEGQLASIRIQGLETVPEKTVLDMIEIPKGKPIHVRKLQEAYQELSNSVYFTKVNLNPQRGYQPSDIILTWSLSERKVLTEPVEAEKITLKGNSVFPIAQLNERLGNLPSGTVNNFQVLTALKDIHSLYRKHGYSKVNYVAEGVEGGSLSVRLEVATITDIAFQGNTKTADTIVRNQILLEEGSPFNDTNLNDSRRRLLDLGYFSKVEVNTNNSSDGVSLTYNITEKPKLGSLRGGLTWSGGGFAGQLSVSQKNFFGLGQDLSLSFQRGFSAGASMNGSLSWKNVYFPPEFDFTELKVYREEEERAKSTITKQGITFSIGYPFDPNLSLNLSYTSELADQSGETSNTSLAQIISSSLLYDTRDNPRFPTVGNKWTATVEKAGGFAAGTEFTKGSLTGLYFTSFKLMPFLEDMEQVLATRARVGFGLNTSPAYSNMLGGSNSIRGITPREVTNYGLANTEYRIQLLKQRLYLSTFLDMGVDLSQPTTDNFHVAAGLEINLQLFGHLRVGLGWPLTEKLQPVPRIYFGIGQIF